MTVTLVLPACRGSGSKVLALELATHLNLETGNTSVLLDLSSDAVSPFDFDTNCLLALLYNMIHPSDALKRYDKASGVLISKLLTNACESTFRKRSAHSILLSESFYDMLSEFVYHLSYKDNNVVIYLPQDFLGRLILKKVFLDRNLIMRTNVVVVTNERKHCLSGRCPALKHEEIRKRTRAILVNKVPMGVFDHVRDEILREYSVRYLGNGTMVLGLIPLTMQLYYRDLNTYIPLPIKAEINEHAKSLSIMMRKVVRSLLGLEEGKRLLMVIKGMLSERLLAPLTQP